MRQEIEHGSKCGVPEIDEYIEIVRKAEYPVCEEQTQLCNMLRRIFMTEELYVDTDQLAEYMGYQKYFPYALYPWEKFCFALHNCVYRADGQLRFPFLIINIGRGGGKNGYLAFEDFGLLTPTNGIKEYHIDIFATSEDQAKQSFTDIYNVLQDNAAKMKRHFRWTKELIVNTDTGSELRFRTSNAKTKDGGRPGKVDFDEYHAYENYKLIDVAVTGLGKKRLPRRTIITTNGIVRDGPYDDLLNTCEQILSGEIDDNGMLPFICRLTDEEQINDKRNWHKANPSLRYFPDLQYEMTLEYVQYLQNPIANKSFAIKRMNIKPKHLEGEITKWENIEATNKELDESRCAGLVCVGGIDYAKTTDFVSACLDFEIDGEHIDICHTWVCRQSADLPRIKAPLEHWESAGLLTMVDALEISPDLPVWWIAQKLAELGASMPYIGMDSYRYTLFARSLKEYLYMSDEDGWKNVMLIRPSDEMQTIPLITSDFNNRRFTWGDNPLLRWAAWNSKLITSNAGNTTYGKIEPLSRKTDPFKAIVAARCARVKAGMAQAVFSGNDFEMKVYTY